MFASEALTDNQVIIARTAFDLLKQNKGNWMAHWASDKKTHWKLFPIGMKPTSAETDFAVSIYGPKTVRRQLTTFPVSEVKLPSNFVFACRKNAFYDEVQTLAARFGQMTNLESSQALFQAIDASIDRLLEGSTLHPSIQMQSRLELQSQFYAELLKGQGVETRRLQLAENGTRDGAQSNLGRTLSMKTQCMLITRYLESGLPISTIETGGGATAQFDKLLDRVGDYPTLAFKRSRRSMMAQRKVVEKLIREVGADPNHECFNELFVRFTPGRDRKFLDREKVQSILNYASGLLGIETLGSTGKVGSEIIRLYFILQTYLFRGKFGVVLNEIPAACLPLLIRAYFENGCDVLRVFDGLNHVKNMRLAIETARELGMWIQPVLHADPHFEPGIDGFMKNLLALVPLCGDRLESIVVKDAPGIVKPEFAFNFAKRLTSDLAEMDISVPVVFHTHDNSGSSMLSCLEFVRGCGPTQVVRIETALGKGALASPNGQPSMLDFLSVVMGTNWQPETSLSVDEVMDIAEKLEVIAKEAVTELSPLPIELTSDDRFLANEAGLPGGMTGTYLLQLRKTLVDYAALFTDKLGQHGLVDDKKQLTDTGKKLLRAYFRVCMNEMKLVNLELGCVSRVTPVSQWIGNQAQSLVDFGIRAGFYQIETSEDGLVFIQTENYKRTTLYESKGCLVETTRDYLIVLSTSEELQAMYPKADRSLMRLAIFSALSRTEKLKTEFAVDSNAIEAAIPLSCSEPIKISNLIQAFGLLERVRELSGRSNIDVEVIKAAEILMNNQPALLQLKINTLKRENFVQIANNPLFMNDAELRLKYRFDEVGEIDYILLSCFTQANLGPLTISRREKMREILLRNAQGLLDAGLEMNELINLLSGME